MPFKDYLVDKAASSLDPFYFDDELIPFYAWLVILFFQICDNVCVHDKAYEMYNTFFFS